MRIVLKNGNGLKTCWSAIEYHWESMKCWLETCDFLTSSVNIYFITKVLLKGAK